MDGEALLSLIKAQTVSASCEFTCFTVPTPVNQSMYRDDNARNKDYVLNKRATALMRACGHALPADASNEDGKPSGVHGGVFIGRCHDNELDDIWERVDL